MSGLLNTLHDLHQQHKERREERHEGRHGHHGGGGHNEHDNYGSQGQHHGPRPSYQGNDDDDRRRPPPQSYGQGQGQGQGGYAPPSGPPPSQRYGQRPSGYGGNDDDDDNDGRRPQSYGQGQGQRQEQGGYAPPSGPPPSTMGGRSGFQTQGGLDRGDFASDADIDRMVASGKFDGGDRYGDERHGGADLERRGAYGRHDASNVAHPGQGYGESGNDYGRYDAPSGPPPGRGYQSQESYQPGYGGGGSDRSNQYGAPQGRSQYESPQAPGRGQGNTPGGGFSTSRNEEDRYSSGYGGSNNDRSEPRGEAASYYNQQGGSGQGDRYAHLAGMAQEHGDDPELYRRATKGLQEKIQRQAQSRPAKDDGEDDYKAQVAAHRKAYGDDDGPMDNDTIGAAAAMEAIKQTAAAAKSSNAPKGALQASKGGGGSASRAGRAAQEEEEEETAAARGGASGGLQDKMMALAMSHAGKLFDKKNASRPAGGDKEQDKAQAMQSAAVTAMQLFGKYKAGKLDSSDMQSVMTLAMKMM